MRILKEFFIIGTLSLCLFSCEIFRLGYTDLNNQYVPKKPKFKLKDKSNNEFPDNLDTINVYMLKESYYQGKAHPALDDKYSELNKIIRFIKFYSNGRCLSFSISAKEEFGNNNKLKEDNLNPNNANYSKNYYFSKDGKKISIESFVFGEGTGLYVILDYFLSSSGDTLTMIHDNSKEVYVKEKLPSNWKKYRIDW